MKSKLTNLSEIILYTVAISALMGGVYWWFNPIHIPHNFSGYWHIIDALLFSIVSYIIWLPLMLELLTWLISSHIKMPREEIPASGLKVAFITTIVPSNESLSLLHKCLPAMKKAYYPHDTWILDEANSDAVKKICEQYGVRHFSRFGNPNYNTRTGKYQRKTKGGNHNSWYQEFGNQYDFVAQIDTDFIPKKTFLTQTLGYFNDPSVGFVGTPQIYANTQNSFIALGAAQQTYSFYGNILQGLSGMKSALLIGANHIVRVAALQSVDHYSAHITEDMLTGMKLHAKGWKSVYLPVALALGEGPITWQSYFNQQMRWAYGCMDILFNHSFRLFKKMSLRNALYYFSLQQYYFLGLAFGLSIILLGLYFIFGISDADIDIYQFIIFSACMIVISMMTTLWLQRYNINPKEERGLLLSSKLLGVASVPIFLIAFFAAILKKKLTYKVTPKGNDIDSAENSIKLFIPHILIGFICEIYLVISFFTHRQNVVMIFWVVLTGFLMFTLPFSLGIYDLIGVIRKRIIHPAYQHNKYFELSIKDRLTILPNSPTRKEKYLYTFSKNNWLISLFVISFIGVGFSMIRFFITNPLMWPLIFYFILTFIYFIVSLMTIGKGKFDLNKHKHVVRKWQHKLQHTHVDIFLPTAGEPIEVLDNTWGGIKDMIKFYSGRVTVYCLDDGDRADVKELAAKYGFKYSVREDRGWFKKAGNLRHGFGISRGEFIVIFDADFRPRKDFLNETLPYFYENKFIGIVQTPQYFEVNSSQNWLERGAGAVQEFFYRYSQVTRQGFDASICVGSNAVYRRAALKEIGGTALIEHSEDVHTGFDLRMQGWTLQYIPIILAKGLCPSDMKAFFKQQYRWCLGSMSLLTSKKFLHAKMPFMARLSYFSGFLYYVHTAVSSLIGPIIPLALIFLYPAQVNVLNYFFLIPSIIYAWFIFPVWNNAIYGIEAWTTRSIYGWAHLFAITDSLLHKTMSWQPTGSKVKKDIRYTLFRFLQFTTNFFPSILWVGASAYHIIFKSQIAFYPLMIAGIYYFLMNAKIVFYTSEE